MSILAGVLNEKLYFYAVRTPASTKHGKQDLVLEAAWQLCG